MRINAHSTVILKHTFEITIEALGNRGAMAMQFLDYFVLMPDLP